MGESGESGGSPGSAPRASVSAYVFVALMVLIGSTTATAAKFAVRELPVGLLPLVRFGGAGLCLLPIVWRGGSLARMIRQDAGWLIAAAALCVPINQSFFLSATRLAPTSHVALIYAACPLIVLLLAVAMGQERFDWGRLGGVLTTVAGVIIIGLGNLWSGANADRDALRGDLLTIGAVVSWGAYLTVSKRLVARHGALPALAGIFLLGSLLDIPVAYLMNPNGLSVPMASGTAWRALAYLTLIVSVFGLASQNQALRRLDASQVATFGNLAPVLTVVWGVWLLGEAVTPALAVGGSLALGGILWTGRAEAAKTSAHARASAKGCAQVITALPNGPLRTR